MKILSVWSFIIDNLVLRISDPTDPEVIIQIDISNVFNTTFRVLTLDVLGGRTSRDYDGLKEGQGIHTH